MEQLRQLFVKYLAQLKDEINAYPDRDLWRLAGSIPNTPGNLCLHICGNIKHNIGAVIGKSGYVRMRDLEFSRKDVSREELLQEVEGTIGTINLVLENLNENDLRNQFPADDFSQGGTAAEIILRVAAHLGYHLGQINYHRRMISELSGRDTEVKSKSAKVKRRRVKVRRKRVKIKRKRGKGKR